MFGRQHLVEVSRVCLEKGNTAYHDPSLATLMCKIEYQGYVGCLKAFL
jgi:hypothetical protein